MKLIIQESNDVYFNLATEEYFMTQKDLDIFMLWRNDNCVVIGKNQNSHKEININYVKENKIDIVRRMSGGGTVFHDLGNLNFTFIKRNAKDDFLNFDKFIQPIINTLDKLGIKAESSGRNDILIDGKKFSGNAQYVHNDKLLHHGTIMFSVIVSYLTKVLNVDKRKIQSKGIDSILSRVTNIVDHLKNEYEKTTIEDFTNLLISEIKNEIKDIEEYKLTKEDIKQINILKKEKYSNWNYVFGKNPEYEINNSEYYPDVGTIDVYLNVKESKITDIKFYGDFFSKKDISFIEKKLIGLKHNKEIILKELNKIDDFNDFFFNLNKEKIARIISYVK